MRELAERLSRVEGRLDQRRREIAALEALAKNNESEHDERVKMIRVLRTENQFIEEEEQRFGTEGSEYDFAKIDIKKLSDQSGKLQKEIERLKKMIKIHVDEVGDDIEKQYEKLVDKRKIVTQDRKRLQKTITELDTKKKEALAEVWKKVNIDFGSIFSTLLPSAQSSLVPVNEADITDGLEFRVAFKDIVKESLSELSGGQRTLLALSYIFALLKYKPAPLYILDEIDAALDISHTQNIGLMIRKEFPQSQFLVVSLKEGMFNNANVLYRVSFVSGSSKVERLALRETKVEDEDKAKKRKR